MSLFDSGQWAGLLILLIIALGVSFFADPKIRGIGHLILGAIAILMLFGLFQDLQRANALVGVLGNLMSSYSNSKMGNIIQMGYGLYLEIIGIIMLVGGGVMELKS